MESIQGFALVASPYLTDPNFMRSVVYILRHDEDGALGLVLNRPLEKRVGKLLGELSEIEIDNTAPVYYGGPVDGPLVMLQKLSVQDANQYSDCVQEIHGDGMMATGLCVASDQERILAVCGSDACPNTYRVFDGYSGWSAGQLEHELQSGGWLVWDVSPDQVFFDPDEIWKLAIRQIGRDILSGGIDPSKIPEDPAYN